MIRRPVIFAAAAFISAIIICYYFNVLIAFLIALFILIRTLSAQNRCRWLVLFFYMISLLNFQYHNCLPNETGQYIGVSKNYYGIVKCIQIKENHNAERYLTLEVDVTHAGGKKYKRKERVLVKTYNYDTKLESVLFPGEKIVFNGIAEKPSVQRNPGCFDYELYLRSINIKHIIVSNSVCLQSNIEKSGIIYKINRYIFFYKEEYLTDLEKLIGKESADFMRALLFGDKNRLNDDVQEEFQKNGTAHILAVSGLHIGIIYGLISKLWIWKKDIIFFVLTIIFFTCYMYLSDFAPSVIRAVVMLEMHSFAIMTNRRYDIVSSALAVLTMTVFCNPYCIFNVSIQMSYIAVMAIAMILPVIKSKYNGIFLSSISVQIALVPYTMYVFNYLSIITVIINIPIIFLTGILVPVGIVNMFVYETPVCGILSALISGLCDMIIKFNSLTCIEGVTSFDVVSPDIILVLLFYILAGLLFSEEGRLLYLRKKYDKLLILFICAVVFSVSIGLSGGNYLKECNIVFVDVGQGDCIHISQGENNYLIDGGGSINYNVGKNTLKEYLLKNGVRRVDGAFVTHLHTDHYKGIVELCREGMVEKLFVYESNKMKKNSILEETCLGEDDVFFLHKNKNVLIGENITIKVLWPEKKSDDEYMRMIKKESDENESSLIMKVEVGDIKVLATGDVDEKCQDNLAAIYGSQLKCDIIKVAHHGSKYSYSDAFVECSAPQYAVFQVGKNNFGHPNEGVVEKYSKKGIMIYRNDINGAIGFKLNKTEELVAETMIERQ